MRNLQEILIESSSRHSHLCPRQVLGVRMALYAGKILGVELPVTEKVLWVIVETDGCFLDGIEVAAGVTPGHRTLRVVDYGKIAATFIAPGSNSAIRIAPNKNIREMAFGYAPAEGRHYFAQLNGYQAMPDDELFTAAPVYLTPGIDSIISRPGIRTECSLCGEEIINERELVIAGVAYCQACAGQSYYQKITSEMVRPIPVQKAVIG